MIKRKANHPNALKHGAFAKMTILPGEDPREFEELHSALIEEWTPVGPTEEDAVLTIAKGVWRKRRLQKLFQAEIKLDRLDRDHVLYDQAGALRRFLSFIEDAPDSFAVLERGINHVLSVRLANHLLKRCARQDFENPSAWREALCERASIMLPVVEHLQESSPEMLLKLSSKDFTSAVFDYEIRLDERVDVMIDRAVKRLVQTKAMKQVLATTSPDARTDRTKKLSSNKPDRSTKMVSKKQNGRRSDNSQQATGMEKANPPSS